tara:strand:- start:287 stop:1048 length:762 start_codon:yes stop_codon:yes gene_type:complete
MAKIFYYDSVGLSDLSSGSIMAGTHSGTTFSPSAGAVTNEHRIKDQSIGHGVSSFDAGDCIRIDFGGALSTASDFMLIYHASADVDDLIIYTASSATATGSGAFSDSSSTAGWNLLSFGNSNRYLFIESSTGAFTGGLSEVIIGTKLTFENEPDIGIATQEMFATDINKSYGGVEYANKRHEPQSTWTLNFSNISQTFRNNLASMEADITNYKKFVYYDDSAYHYVRLDAPIKFTEVAYQRFSASLKLREQLS